MKTVLFIIDKTFPYGDAFSCRARNFTKLFSDCGYHVEVIAQKSKAITCDELAQYDYHCNYIVAPQNIATLAGFGTAKPYLEAIDDVISKVDVEFIFSNSIPFVTSSVIKLANRLGIPYYVEHCEWYDPSIFKGKEFNPYYIEHIKLLNRKMRKVSGIVAISRYLENHFLKLGIPVVRIPTILDMQHIKPRLYDVTQTAVINITFAGSLGKGKENLRPMLTAAEKVNENSKKIHLHIYGANEKQVLQNIGNDTLLLDKSKAFASFYGRIPQNEVEEKIRKADFTFFMRPSRRSSDAGFPTKLAESMSVGTPVITNDTGDIKEIIRNGVNGFVVNDETELIDVLQEIVSMDELSRNEMRKEARRAAELFFDYRIYKEAVSKLFM